MLIPLDVFSQAKQPMPLTVRDLAVDALETPRFNVNVDAKAGKPILNRSNWLELRTEFRTDKDWIDEAQFKYYLLMDQSNPRMLPEGAARANILTGEVTYQDIPKHTGHTSDGCRQAGGDGGESAGELEELPHPSGKGALAQAE